MIIELSEQEQIRRESLAKLRELGIEPYPAAEYPVNATADEILKGYNPEAGNFSGRGGKLVVLAAVEAEGGGEAGGVAEEDCEDDGEGAEADEDSFGANCRLNAFVGVEDAADEDGNQQHTHILNPVDERIRRAQVALGNDLRHARPHC